MARSTKGKLCPGGKIRSGGKGKGKGREVRVRDQ